MAINIVVKIMRFRAIMAVNIYVMRFGALMAQNIFMSCEIWGCYGVEYLCNEI
jgi:hypothetical protein